MAFYDFLFGIGGSPLKRHARWVANRDAQPEDRELSANWLAEQGTEEALVALCSRFSLQLEHGLKDRKEKELVFDLLVEKGSQGAEVARIFARRDISFAYPLKVIERIEGSTAATEFLLELLAAESVDNELKPEKKRNLLVALAERKHPRLAETARPFLRDYDEGVRHAAIECIAAQEGDVAYPALLAALQNPKEESTRIRGRLSEIFQQRRWTVPTAPTP